MAATDGGTPDDAPDRDGPVVERTSEFLSALEHSAADVASTEFATDLPTVETVTVELADPGHIEMVENFAERNDFSRVATSSTGTGVELRFATRLDDIDLVGVEAATDAETEADSDSEADPVHSPDAWEYSSPPGVLDQWVHRETGLRVRLDKKSGRTIRHDDYRFVGRIRGGPENYAEPLTGGGSGSREALQAAAAKFMNADPEGEYEPTLEPAGSWDSDRARWPDRLGVENEYADTSEWLK